MTSAWMMRAGKLGAAWMLIGLTSLAAAPATGVAVDRIKAAHIIAHVKFLADDLLEGRAPATRGGDLAAKYIATQYELLGLEPAGEKGTYFQQVPIIESLAKPDMTLSIKGSKSESFKFGTDFVAASGIDEATVAIDAPVIFVGYGIVAPEYKWNDYAGVDVKGKIVLVMVNDPPATTCLLYTSPSPRD